MANRNKQKVLHDRDALNRAFKAMRRWGLIARQNFSCCQGCAGYEIATQLKDKIEAGEDVSNVKGACFYTRQDAEKRDAGQPFCLSFGPVEISSGLGELVTLGGTEEEVGNTVCEILDKFGIGFEWNGSGGTRIMVLPNGWEVAA